MGRFVALAGISLIAAITSAQMLLRMKKEGLKALSLAPFGWAAVMACVANPGLIKNLFKEGEQLTMENAVGKIKTLQANPESILLSDDELYALAEGLDGMNTTDRGKILTEIEGKNPTPATLDALANMIGSKTRDAETVKGALQDMTTNDSLRRIVSVMNNANEAEREVVLAYLEKKGA